MTMQAVVPAQRQKAAIIVQLLKSRGTDMSLSAMSDDAQVALTQALGRMGPVDRMTLSTVVSEFADALDDLALPSPRGMEGAMNSLGDKLSPSASARLTEEIARTNPDHNWTRLGELGNAELARIITAETSHIGALILSKLPVPQAAAVLGEIPGKRARRLAYMTARIDDMPAATVARIAHALAEAHCNAPEPSFAKPAVARVGDILNTTSRDRRDEVLEGLDSDDPDFAREVRATIFTFTLIPHRIEPLDVPKIIKGVDTVIMAEGLAGAIAAGGEDAEAAEYILSNMSSRMAQGLRDEIEEIGTISAEATEDAQSTIVAAIREAVDAGEIAFKMPAGT